MKYSSGAKKNTKEEENHEKYLECSAGKIIPLCLGTGPNCPEFTGHKTNHSKCKRVKL